MEWILTPERIYGAMGLVAAYAGMCWGIGSRVRRQRLVDEAQSQLSQGDAQAPAVLVAYASQTGRPRLWPVPRPRCWSKAGFRCACCPWRS